LLRRTALALAWLAAAAVIALGAAGIVAALDQLPGGGGRPELTWTADREVGPSLDAAAADLVALADAVGALGEDGREALAALVARDGDALDTAIEAGAARLDAIDAAAAALETRLAAMPLGGPQRALGYSPATLARYDALLGALPAVAPLRSSWEQLAVGVVPAVDLTDRLLAHDEIAGEAIRFGGAGSYRAAIARIDRATAQLEEARKIRDRLAAAVDVTTLDEWIARNADYDAAVRALWDALRRSGGRVTDAVRDAAAGERAAKELLPPDARALVIILGDVARGGLNQAVIAIEEARGDLLAALARASGSPAPAASPGPDASPAPPSLGPAATPAP
jgi:hypothetical protein